MIVYRTFRFHSARYLPKLDDDHICKKMHGHTFNLTIYVKGKINKKNGFVIDFYDIDKIVNNKIISKIDHKVLNDLPDLPNPTSEHLCKWIWDKLHLQFDILSKIILSEDHGTGIVYKGE
tara:strand:- start:283 stop:642 length:360 start_codon:yes stop_codon:yes gene_type:complete